MKILFLLILMSLKSLAIAETIDCKVVGVISATPERSSDGSWRPDLNESSVSFNFESNAKIQVNGTATPLSLDNTLSGAISSKMLNTNSQDALVLGTEILRLIQETKPQLIIKYLPDLDMISASLNLETKKLTLDQTGDIQKNSSFRSTAGTRKPANPDEYGYTRQGFRVYLGDGKMQYSGNMTINTICN